MTNEEHIQRWILSSDRDIPAMEILYANQHYVWSLFLGHLVIEKLLKAHYVKMVGDNVPYTHNLLKIARATGLELTEQQESLLDEVTDFNIQARYQDRKDRFYRLATREFTASKLAAIKEFRVWLLQRISEQ